MNLTDSGDIMVLDTNFIPSEKDLYNTTYRKYFTFISNLYAKSVVSKKFKNWRGEGVIGHI